MPRYTDEELLEGVPGICLSTRPIVRSLTVQTLEEHERQTPAPATPSMAMVDPQQAVRTLLTVTVEGESFEDFDAARFKARIADRLDMQPTKIEVEKVRRRAGQVQSHWLQSGTYRMLVRVDEAGYLQHVEATTSGSSGGSSSELSATDTELMDDEISVAIRRAVTPKCVAKEAIVIQWIEKGSVIVCIELDLPYALKLLELCKCRDPVLSEMNIVSCVLGEQRKAARADITGSGGKKRAALFRMDDWTVRPRMSPYPPKLVPSGHWPCVRYLWFRRKT